MSKVLLCTQYRKCYYRKHIACEQNVNEVNFSSLNRRDNKQRWRCLLPFTTHIYQECNAYSMQQMLIYNKITNFLDIIHRPALITKRRFGDWNLFRWYILWMSRSYPPWCRGTAFTCCTLHKILRTITFSKSLRMKTGRPISPRIWEDNIKMHIRKRVTMVRSGCN